MDKGKKEIIRQRKAEYALWKKKRKKELEETRAWWKSQKQEYKWDCEFERSVCLYEIERMTGISRSIAGFYERERIRTWILVLTIIVQIIALILTLVRVLR